MNNPFDSAGIFPQYKSFFIREIRGVEKKMRDPERIAPILEELKRIWEENPDLRFFQLIFALNKGQDLFHMEDDKVLNLLKEFK